jgi:Ca-activated chloride channel family protein
VFRTISIALLTALTLSAPSSGQDLERDGTGFTIDVDVELVVLPVSVQDRDGAPVIGLEQEHFQVFEDGVEQTVSRFLQEDVPVSVGLVIDTSGSMRNKRERVASSALVFISESNPADETFIVTFNDETYLEQTFTGSIGNLVDTLENLDARGETAFNDAVWVSLDEVETQSRLEKKALLVITDGEDNASSYGTNPVLERLKDTDATVYIIGLLELDDERGGLFRRSPSSRARRTLREMAESTGGQAFFPETLDEVEELCRRVAHDLRNHYTINYVPSNPNYDGTWREVEVKVNPPRGFPRIEVHTKQGYYAPGGEPEDEGDAASDNPE